jgi:hypothetical protein
MGSEASAQVRGDQDHLVGQHHSTKALRIDLIPATTGNDLACRAFAETCVVAAAESQRIDFRSTLGRALEATVVAERVGTEFTVDQVFSTSR